MLAVISLFCFLLLSAISHAHFGDAVAHSTAVADEIAARLTSPPWLPTVQGQLPASSRRLVNAALWRCFDLRQAPCHFDLNSKTKQCPPSIGPLVQPHDTTKKQPKLLK